MLPRHIIKSAKPGSPSILWQGKSGRYYRNVVHAKTDKAANAYDAAPAVKAQAQAKKSTNYLMYIIVFAIVFFVAYKLFSKQTK